MDRAYAISAKLIFVEERLVLLKDRLPDKVERQEPTGQTEISVNAITNNIMQKRMFRNSIGMELVYIPAGRFMMGTPYSDVDLYYGEVTLSKPFYMGIYEVTQTQYEAIMGKNPSKFKGGDNPVEQVSRYDAVEFCRKLSRKEGKTYRLPTEAEWEFACRAGTNTRFNFGDSELSMGDYAWYSKNSNSRSHPVGQKKPNAFGLYDMHGNVREWCSNWYGYGIPERIDPQGPSSGQNGVLRGGCWDFKPESCRSVSRDAWVPTNHAPVDGFRVVLSISSLSESDRFDEQNMKSDAPIRKRYRPSNRPPP